VINLCANNYLGLSSHPKVIEAAHEALRTHGYGLSSVRFICGTQDLHKSWRASGPLPGHRGHHPLRLGLRCQRRPVRDAAGPEDAVISDELNHASIIDGIRLSRRAASLQAQRPGRPARAIAAGRCRWRALQAGVHRRRVLDGRHRRAAGRDPRRSATNGALLGIDECHATGFMGARGRGTHEARGVFGKIDIITGTLGKALGGASGGFTSGRKEVSSCCASARDLICSRTPWRRPSSAAASPCSISWKAVPSCATSWSRTPLLPRGHREAGFDIKPGDHPIVPIMVYDAEKAQQLADACWNWAYVVGFFYPVVPKGQARIRVQMSGARCGDAAVRARCLRQAGRELGLIR
jgi:glycine C-acetyltransferase